MVKSYRSRKQLLTVLRGSEEGDANIVELGRDCPRRSCGLPGVFSSREIFRGTQLKLLLIMYITE